MSSLLFSRTVFVLSLLLVFTLGGCAGEVEPPSPFDSSQPEDAPPTAPPSPAEDQPEVDALAAEFAQYVADWVAENELLGASLALVHGDELILAQGYGLRNWETEEPVTPETLFHIGSAHKAMNATLIAMLVDEGVLDWDAPITEYAPQFSLGDEEMTNAVSLRLLLSMRAGIPDDAEYDLPDDANAEDIFDVIGQADPLGEPGAVFSYSNLSASAAGFAAALATGGSNQTLFDDYAGLMTERLLRPLGMERSTLYQSQAAQDRDRALAYAWDGEDYVRYDGEDRDGDPLAPSGSLKSSATEMARFVSLMINRGVAGDGTRLLSPETLAQTWQPYLEQYGMGWQIEEVAGLTLIWHPGAFDGYVSVIGFFPEVGVGYVLLSNEEDGGDELTEEAGYALAELLADNLTE